MNTSDIVSTLKGVPGFLGVFAWDNIPTKIHVPSSCVFNTDPSNKPGKHWIAVIVLSNRIEYFDATGRSPIITDIFRKMDKPVLYNNHRIQSPHSIACGYFCCDFVLRRSRGETFCEILSSFSRNTLFNDFLLMLWHHSLFFSLLPNIEETRCPVEPGSRFCQCLSAIQQNNFQSPEGFRLMLKR